MKKIIGLGLLLSFVFIASAAVHLPVKAVLDYAPMPKQLKIEGATGTLWQGSAKNIRWQRQNLGELQWQLQPTQLFTGRVEAQVRFGRGSDMQVTGRGLVGYSLSGAYAENIIASIPVEKVMEVAPAIPVPIDITGQVELNLRSYTYAAPYCGSAKGTVVLSSDVVGTPLGDLSVGPVIADFTCQENELEFKGEQKSSHVESGFTATLNAKRQYTSQAWFTPKADFPDELGQQLKWLPDPDTSGKYRFNNKGRI